MTKLPLFRLSFLIISLACQPKEDEPFTTSSTDVDVADSNDETGAPDSTGPTIWSGPTLTFTKADGVDHTQPTNQDAITDNVVLTRGDRGSLLNVVLEDTANTESPAGTEWAVGSTDALETLVFEPLKTAANDKMKNLPGTDLVLHLTEEDIYIDVTFLSWSSGGDSGGGFGYERSTETE